MSSWFQLRALPLVTLCLLGSPGLSVAADTPPDRWHARGFAPDSALGAEVAATVDRLRAGDGLEGRRLAFLRIVERLSGDSDFVVEFMEPRLPAGSGADSTIVDGPDGRVVTGGLFVGAAPRVLDRGSDAAVVRFVGTDLYGGLTGARDLALQRVHALWIRETGPEEYVAEVVPWGPEPMQITGVRPAPLATTTRVPSVAAFVHLLRVGLDPTPRFGDEFAIAPVAIRRLEAQVRETSIDRRPDLLSLARLYAAFDRPGAAVDLYLGARPDLPRDPRLDLEWAQAAWFAGRPRVVWRLLRASGAVADPLGVRLCRAIAGDVGEARRRCPDTDPGPTPRSTGPAPARTLLHRDGAYLDGFADGLIVDLEVTTDDRGAGWIDVAVQLSTEGMWADVVLVHAPPFSGWRRLRMHRVPGGLRTARLGFEPDGSRPTRLYLRAVDPRSGRVLARYLDPFEPERIFADGDLRP